MSAQDFISLMVQETLDTEYESGEKVLPFQMPKCFELAAIYDAHKKCYLIAHGEKTLEIPKNWGPFKNRISSEFVLLNEDDKTQFLEILSTFMGEKITHLKVQLINSEVQVMRDSKSAA